jgi:hypothetical protein
MIAPGMLRCGPASATAVEFPGDREQVTGAVEVDGRAPGRKDFMRDNGRYVNLRIKGVIG